MFFSCIRLRRVSERLVLPCTIATMVALVSGCTPSSAERTVPINKVNKVDKETRDLLCTRQAQAVDVEASAQLTFATTDAHSGHAPHVEQEAEAGQEEVLVDGAVLNVEQIVTRAAAHNPSRDIFRATQQAAAAQVQVAGAWSNPELEISGGRALYEGGGSSSIYAASLQQRFEMPGKRSARIEAARVGQATAQQEIAVDALALEAAVRMACANYSAAEEDVSLLRAAYADAVRVHETVLQRIESGEMAASAGARATLDLVTAQAQRDRSERLLIAHRAAVQIWSGNSLPDEFLIAGEAQQALPIINREQAIAQAIAQHPRLSLLAVRLQGQHAQLEYEKRAWQPDVTIGVFTDRDADVRNTGLSIGIEIPLWNRNQGGIAVAQAERDKALAEQRAEQAIILRNVDLTWQLYETQRLQLDALINQAQTAAQAALHAQMAAFDAGEIALLDVLEAKRAALDIEKTILEARRATKAAWLHLRQAMGSFVISGSPITAVPNSAATTGEQP